MAEANIKATVSIEAVLHSTFTKFAQEISDKYGVKITTVDFDWSDHIGAPPVIRDCRVLSTTSSSWFGDQQKTSDTCPKCQRLLDPPDPLDEEPYCRVCGYVSHR